ncbi:hypothetical protein GQ457_09G007050 [Hibiscus cannabinus]
MSTVSPSVLPQLVGVETTSAIWNTILRLYASLSTTKIMHLHCRLRSLKKGTLSMRDYTTQVREICDLLATCGSVVSEVEQIATILNGLPPEFEHFVAVITASREPYTLEAAISVLIDAETSITWILMEVHLISIRIINATDEANATDVHHAAPGSEVMSQAAPVVESSATEAQQLHEAVDASQGQHYVADNGSNESFLPHQQVNNDPLAESCASWQLVLEFCYVRKVGAFTLSSVYILIGRLSS